MFCRPGQIGIGIGRTGLAPALPPFNPMWVIKPGSQAAWGDVSDLSTLFQDIAGTVPAAVGASVALAVDKSGRGNNAFMATAIDRPILRQDSSGRYYLETNGTNSWMQTNSINFGSSDKMTVLAGVRTTSSADGQIIELSATQVSNTGSFQLRSNLSAPGTYTFGSRGSTFSAGIATTGASYTPPYSAVLTGVGDIAGDLSVLRVNGVQVASSAVDQGTGNYGNYPAYIGRRGGSSIPFGGRIYGWFIYGGALTAYELAQMERWMASKTGVTL